MRDDDVSKLADDPLFDVSFPSVHDLGVMCFAQLTHRFAFSDSDGTFQVVPSSIVELTKNIGMIYTIMVLTDSSCALCRIMRTHVREKQLIGEARPLFVVCALSNNSYGFLVLIALGAQSSPSNSV